MLGYAVTIFVSAFLLFQVQPMIGKYILPWFGGGLAVWTTCMLYFQVVLLAGYAYANFLVRTFSPRNQARIHLVLLLVSLFPFWIAPSDTWKPDGAGDPTQRILLLLCATLGLKYFVISSTGPLLQGWFSTTHSGTSPYRMYALSNVGSLLALLSYPFFFERVLTLSVQTWWWSVGYGLFVLLCGWRAVALGDWAKTQGPNTPTPGSSQGHPPTPESAPAASEITVAGTDKAATSNTQSETPPDILDRFLWVLLSFSGSLLLLGTTNQLCQDVAVIPFLWIMPLTIYLLSFILCFDSDWWYWRPLWVLPFAFSFIVALMLLYEGVDIEILWQVILYALVQFICSMVCHGELAALKPHPKYLTGYFLSISLGGALGGIFVSFVAPVLFLGYWEYHLSLFLCLMAFMFATVRGTGPSFEPGKMQAGNLVYTIMSWCVGFAGLAALAVALVQHAKSGIEDAAPGGLARSFYGVMCVTQDLVDDEGDEKAVFSYALRHGRITHGIQYMEEELEPTSYYGRESGVGMAILYHPKRNPLAADPGRAFEQPALPLRVGIVGLGAGTSAALGSVGDYFRFYEINPVVLRLSDKFFTYRSKAFAKSEVILGDARVSMEQEAKRGEVQDFDVLAIDAFSSDAIPVHLLTSECGDIYKTHLRPDGILAIHISNRYLDLEPVVYGLAKYLEWEAVVISNNSSNGGRVYPSTWVLVTRNKDFLAELRQRRKEQENEAANRRDRALEDLGNLEKEEADKKREEAVELFDIDIADIREDMKFMGETTNERSLLWTDDYSNLYEVVTEKKVNVRATMVKARRWLHTRVRKVNNRLTGEEGWGHRLNDKLLGDKGWTQRIADYWLGQNGNNE